MLIMAATSSHSALFMLDFVLLYKKNLVIFYFFIFFVESLFSACKCTLSGLISRRAMIDTRLYDVRFSKYHAHAFMHMYVRMYVYVQIIM